jgi:magnesium chelatase family protein
VSGPILDRLDIQIEVPALTSGELLRAANGEASARVRDRVLAARGTLNALLASAALARALRARRARAATRLRRRGSRRNVRSRRAPSAASGAHDC